LKARSIRVRLTLWYAFALTLALLGYAGIVYALVRASLSAELDRKLHEDAELVEHAYGSAFGGTPPRPGSGALRRGIVGGEPSGTIEIPDEGVDPPRRLEIFLPDGRLFFRQSSDGTFEGGRFRTRELAMPGSLLIRVARSEERLNAELAGLLAILGLGLPLTVALASLGGYALARSALEPVGRMAERARRITAERLVERLPVENAGDELGQLATVFNETLARLERSFEQLRRFTQDASHELRTPLTAIKTVGEVGLRDERRDAAAYRDVIGSMLEEADRLARLVDALLTLSRADAGRIPLRPERIDLAELAREVTMHLGVLAEEKKQTLRLEANGPLEVNVDRTVLRQAVVNLVDNAIKYTPEGGHVSVRVATTALGLAVEVKDDGPGIPAEALPRVFERFYRVDKARSRELGGTGLGLAIVKHLVIAHGGELRIESALGRGTRVRFTLLTAGHLAA